MELKENWRNRNALRALEEGGKHPAAEPGGEFDRFGPLLDALRAELEGYKGFLDSQTKAFLADMVNFKSPLASPWAPRWTRATSSGRSARRSGRCCFTAQRRCWLAQRRPPAATSALSVSGRICTKLRGALLPNSIEQLTLAYYYITREVIAVLKQWGRKAGLFLTRRTWRPTPGRRWRPVSPQVLSTFPPAPRTHLPTTPLYFYFHPRRVTGKEGWEGYFYSHSGKKSPK